MVESDPVVGGPIDESQLDRATFGNRMLADDVVRLFCRQTGELIGQLRTDPARTPAILHQIKGGAMAIGAQHMTDLILSYEGMQPDAGLSGAQLLALQSEAERVQAWLMRREHAQK